MVIFSPACIWAVYLHCARVLGQEHNLAVNVAAMSDELCPISVFHITDISIGRELTLPCLIATAELTDEELELTRGRPRGVRQKSPTMKRSRSGRISSPDKVQPRSKSPRLQRPSNLSSPESNSEGEQHLALDDIKAAVQTLLPK